MSLMFSLEIPADKEALLEQKVERGEVVSPKELATTFGGNADVAGRLKQWLQKEGFEVTHATPDNTTVYAKGTVSQIENSLQVHMVHVTRGGIAYMAARDAPSLPNDVGTGVHAIVGLQPFRRANKHARKVRPQHVRHAGGGPGPSHVEQGVQAFEAAPSPVAAAVAPPYLVHDILRAYDADNLGLTGAGQTIAILIDTFPADTDVQSFWKQNNIPVDLARIEKVNVSGQAPPPPEGEESLDVEWSSGVAPGAKVRVYACGSLSFVDLDRALDKILADIDATPGMRQLSISLGLGETYMGGPKGEVATQHKKFLRLAAAGVNVFVSSGDAGSNPDNTGHDAAGPLQCEYEASDPCVIGVGGTSLNLDGTGKVKGETGWSGSGGGRSIFFKRPAWQKGKGVPAGTARLVPDVSLVADPNTGGLVWLGGSPQQYGGTSWAAPVWAAFCALINEARAKAKKPAIGFLNPQLYPLLGTSSFRDVTDGTNGVYHCDAGYDLVTGIGVPSVKNLVSALS
jgi:kumamolisin